MYLALIADEHMAVAMLERRLWAPCQDDSSTALADVAILAVLSLLWLWKRQWFAYVTRLWIDCV